MKGIVLAGGTGSRLWPITTAVSKQLLPVYDKPLVHYPIGTLFLAGIREILIITTPEDLSLFQKLLGDGSQYGAFFYYKTQERPNGLAEAFIIGEDFIGDDDVALILGDNIFHGVGLGNQLRNISTRDCATIFAYKVTDPERYGVVEFDEIGKVVSIEEKPLEPKSRFAITGLYFYNNAVIEIAKTIVPSLRGELEISSINQKYLASSALTTIKLERGTSWFDTGTPNSLHAASSYVKIIEERQGSKISCLEEIAWGNKWISNEKLFALADKFGHNEYANYLRSLLA